MQKYNNWQNVLKYILKFQAIHLYKHLFIKFVATIWLKKYEVI